jgi:hypothetical protein
MKYPVGGGGGGESPALARVSGLRPPVYSVPSLEREEEEEPLRRRRRGVPRTLKAVWNGRGERTSARETMFDFGVDSFASKRTRLERPLGRVFVLTWIPIDVCQKQQKGEDSTGIEPFFDLAILAAEAATTASAGGLLGRQSKRKGISSSAGCLLHFLARSSPFSRKILTTYRRRLFRPKGGEGEEGGLSSSLPSWKMPPCLLFPAVGGSVIAV